MEKMIRRKYLRLVMLLAVMLVGTWQAWGITVNTQRDKTFPQTNIPTLVDTIYMNAGDERTLQVANYQYYYYFRWYQKDGTGTTIDNLDAPSSGGGWGGGTTYLREVTNAPSYVWHHKMSDGNNKENYVAAIDYTSPDNFVEDSVFCDLSFYIDELGINPSTNNNRPITEPTISKRYKFIIKNADAIRSRLNGLNTGVALDTIRITVPYGATNVNLQMDMAPENYYWNTNSHGTQFRYTTDGRNYDTTTNRFIPIDGPINQETTVLVYANTGNYQNGPCLARYILTPQRNSGFATETQIENNEDRNPQDYPEKYQEIGVVDFDFADGETEGVIPRGQLTSDNNMSRTPVNPSLTTYSFADPTLDWINPSGYMPEDAYGLYRSANVDDVSERTLNRGTRGDDWGREYDSDDTRESESRNKTYGWYYTNIDGLQDKELYDRTYYNTNQASVGYFYYVNASAEPGRVVTIPIEGTLCPNTELVVTAWVADITNASTLPNVSLILRGENSETSESEVLHWFSSGEMSLDNNRDRANWKQLCYRITVSSDMLAKYDNFVVEFQNNTPDSGGGDYAIDDIRIYKSLPNIEVYRENACDASTLIVSTDYETILRNMGWSGAGQNVVQDYDVENDLDYRKYRYGLMGENHQHTQNSVVGNVYFAFLDENKENWITINKEAEDFGLQAAAKTIRVAVSTVQSTTGGYEFYTTDREEALRNEQIINYRAVVDYNTDVAAGLWADLGAEHTPIDVTGANPESSDFNEAAYQTAIATLYNRLGIARLRCPWYNEEEGRLYLAIIDVENTDLKYQNEWISDTEQASGNHWVVTFSAGQVAGGESGQIDVDDPCTLMSPFTVLPATTVKIETLADAPSALCAGAIRKITPTLNAYNSETNRPVDDFNTYLFDFYMDSREEYDKIIVNGDSLRIMLDSYRTNTNDRDEITVDEIDSWGGTSTSEQRETLKSLIESGMLITGIPGDETFTTRIQNDEIVAIPYVWDDNENYVYCTYVTSIHLDVTDNDMPDFIVGIPGVTYLTDEAVALRLGRRHIGNEMTLTVPVRKALQMATGADHFGLSGQDDFVYLEEDGTYTPVGELTELEIPRPTGMDGENVDATITVKWNNTALTEMQEGQQYSLWVPFVQIAENGSILASECDGLASFPVKVVPEYLTWQGTAKGKWYVDSNWKQSTRGELHKGDVSTQDANGTDNINNAFSPLYFTNVTILGDSADTNTDIYSELQLETIGATDAKGTLDLGNSYTIQHDMAVADANGTIAPYYINNVNDIYFKPGATLHRQDRLSYKKAWVDFEMTEGTAYWMSSPLKDVYAGDMYAPKEHGRQETEVFKDIKYVGEHEATTTDGILNDRWSPAFYQKAWDNAIEYASGDANNDGIPDEANNEIENVVAVSSNWSIEYNDVTVPYSIKTTDGATTTQKLGKGFYARVENFNNRENKALVRLPKADDDYKYETRALTDLSTDRSQSGQLADKTDFTINLETDVDGDGTHFLIGNPYMAYLNMTSFFNTENLKVLDKKYWTLVEGSTEAAVGTPDVEWTGAKDAGFIAPMQAFFVEKAANVAEGTTLNVTFSPTMVATKEEAESSNTTRSYTATNPQLTLTAQSSNGTSRVAVVQRTDASNQYKSDEDAVTLLDSELKAPTVYTVAGNYAAAVNVVHDCKNIPLGVYADNNEEVELTIEGASQLVEPLYLYDAVTRSTTPIEGDSYTLNLQGSSHGRYFLTTDEGITVESDIRIYSPADGQLIIASTPSDKLKHVQVYDLSGRVVDSRQNIGMTTCQISVPGGIYIIRAESEHGEAQAKLKVK